MTVTSPKINSHLNLIWTPANFKFVMSTDQKGEAILIGKITTKFLKYMYAQDAHIPLSKTLSQLIEILTFCRHLNSTPTYHTVVSAEFIQSHL
jgi:hypothetical protein